ncbi:uncharacterized protein KY384_002845 [Bacidia gigantensis]|uniref:uncharacterized protein n=1 Tax=Bacidia gigantensis TaxID=2732470 RepID=UPI001D03F939|nr:uncharacterized protein KY384_002845 [Bacidia gigantensis]KAG8532360.1 hypothetical protein KY384_002845 [Bacidia gigantensis]
MFETPAPSAKVTSPTTTGADATANDQDHKEDSHNEEVDVHHSRRSGRQESQSIRRPPPRQPKLKGPSSSQQQWAAVFNLTRLDLQLDVQIYLEHQNSSGSAEFFLGEALHVSFADAPENDNPFARLQPRAQTQAIANLYVIEGKLKYVETFTHIR